MQADLALGDVIRMRLEEAGATMLSLPGGYGPRSPGCGLPESVREAAEAYGWSKVRLRAGRPSGEAIDRMDQALLWIGNIPATPGRPGSGEMHSPHGGVMMRRLVWSRLLVDPLSYQQTPDRPRHLLRWGKLAQMLGADRRVVPTWHRAATGLIATIFPPPECDIDWALKICNLRQSDEIRA
jgi:hypothetical protein